MARPRVSWMTRADDRILETLSESNLILSPHVLAVNTDYTRQHITNRLSKLTEAKLVEKVDTGLYKITDRGRAYLTGELDAEELEG